MKKVLRLPLALLVCGLISACGLMGGNGSADLTPAAQAAPAAKANAFNPWMNKSLPNTRTLSAEGMAMVQAMGTALFEELILKNGHILNKNFVDYKIPTADDMPELTVKYIEHAEPTGPYGARGVGEPLMVPGAPAIANAIYDAIGVRFNRMPITAEEVLKALKEKATE